MTTYGHFKLKEFQAGGSSLYFEQSGHWYRITETYAISALDRLNYQAEEMTDHEVAAMKAELMAASLEQVAQQKDEPPFAGAGVPTRPKPKDWDGGAKAELPEPVLLDPTPRPFIRPRIYEWALTQPEYKGRGRVSHFLRQRYAKEFGLQLVPGQSSGGQFRDDDGDE